MIYQTYLIGCFLTFCFVAAWTHNQISRLAEADCFSFIVALLWPIIVPCILAEWLLRACRAFGRRFLP